MLKKLICLFLLSISLYFLSCSVDVQPIAPVYFANVEGNVIIGGFRLLYGGVVDLTYSGTTKSVDVGNEVISGNKAYYYYSFKNLQLDHNSQDVVLQFYSINSNGDEILYKTVTVTIQEGQNDVDITL